jgi:hypothetical protein
METIFSSEKHMILRNKSGKISTVMPKEKVELETSAGTLVPRYQLDEMSRKKESPVKFYKTGELKSVPLEELTEISTSMGKVKGELVTFYKSGALWRVFPLDGQITGYWTEEEEYELAEKIEIPTPHGSISVKPIYIQFYETGELESILFWPKEEIEIDTAIGKVNVRKGICFHKNGDIKGFEPVKELPYETPIGTVKVYDPDPNGLYAEDHSLTFSENGAVTSVVTNSNKIVVKKDGAEFKSFTPKIVTSYCNEDAFFLSPLKIVFENDTLTFINSDETPVSVPASLEFSIEEYIPEKKISCIGCH